MDRVADGAAATAASGTGGGVSGIGEREDYKIITREGA